MSSSAVASQGHAERAQCQLGFLQGSLGVNTCEVNCHRALQPCSRAALLADTVLQRDCHPLSERSWLYWHASATIPLLTASSVLCTLGPYSKTSIWTPFEHPIAAPELRK